MLHGERVTLRPQELEDIKQLHLLFNREIDLVMCGYGNWRPRPLGVMEHWFKKDLDDGLQAQFLIEVDGKAIGEIGLHPWRLNRRDGTAELGIGIYDPEYISKGHGREALDLLLEWSFVNQNLRRLWLTTGATNERAIRSYRSCGFMEEGRLREEEWYDGEYADLVVMGLLRREWEAHRAAQAER
ncbi:MAG: GNAT family N-acetyltransferase [Herpetosiphonaceae bacterium]|nr:GNAT family N-acetyltransferase [Herpetosiphonaceae bacterium]